MKVLIILVRIKRESVNVEINCETLFQMTTLLIGAVSAQTFTRGKRITSRAVKPTSEICAARTNQIKRFCNGDPDTICDSTGFVVSKIKLSS